MRLIGCVFIVWVMMSANGADQAMTKRRIHVTGASGAGVTTLGRALAQCLSIPHHDTDDYFWLPTNPPYREKRPVTDRLALMEALFLPRPDWVLSGSLNGWGDPLIAKFDAVVFVRTNGDVRLKRLHDREARRYGPEAILPGGSAHEQFANFIAWAAGYDDDNFDGRKLSRHEAWLQTLHCPVIRVDGELPLDDLRHQVLGELGLMR